jgi:hypothetical protein
VTVQPDTVLRWHRISSAGSPSGAGNAVLLLMQPSLCWLARCAELQYNPGVDMLLGSNLDLLGVLYYVMKEEASCAAG